MAFWRRRAKRLLPALLVMVLAVAVAVPLFPSDAVARLRDDAVSAFAWVANWSFIAQKTDYFTEGGTPSPLQHTWSLGVEEQYYIIWPVALYLLWRFASPRVTTLVIATAIVLSLGVSIVLSGTHAVAAFYLPITRFWELLFGAALAWAEFHAGARGSARAGARSDSDPAYSRHGDGGPNEIRTRTARRHHAPGRLLPEM